MGDQEIIRLLNENPEKGIHEAMEAYGGAVETICRNFLYDCSEMDIEEAVADTFFKLWKSRNRIECRPDHGMKRYIYEIARNNARDMRKKIKKESLYPVGEVEIQQGYRDYSSSYNSYVTNSFMSGKFEPETEYDRKVISKEVKRCLNELGEPDRSVFVMRYFYGMKIKDIAVRVNVESKKVENILFRGKEKLKKALMERGIIRDEN